MGFSQISCRVRSVCVTNIENSRFILSKRKFANRCGYSICAAAKSCQLFLAANKEHLRSISQFTKTSYIGIHSFADKNEAFILTKRSMSTRHLKSNQSKIKSWFETETTAELFEWASANVTDLQDFEEIFAISSKIQLMVGKMPEESLRLHHIQDLVVLRTKELCSSLSVQSLSRCVETLSSHSGDPGPAIVAVIMKRMCALCDSDNSNEADAIASSLTRTNDRISLHVLDSLLSVEETSPFIKRTRNVLLARHGQTPPSDIPLRAERQNILPQTQLLSRALAFWREQIEGPARHMTGAELGVALGVGIWGGLFPMPGATTGVVAALLALLRFVGFRITTPAAGLAVAINLALTPLQVLRAPAAGSTAGSALLVYPP